MCSWVGKANTPSWVGEAAVDIEKSVAVFLVGVCVVHIHQRYPKDLQCQDNRAALESLWIALVNMYNTDTNKKHGNGLLDIHGGFCRAASVAPPHQL